MSNINSEKTVTRAGDASTRYTSYPEKSFSRVAMEPIHNMLAYCNKMASITVDISCGNTTSIIFENDGTLETIPTWERINMIAEKAGKSITTNNGVSRCGIGLEAFAWSCREHYSKPVIMEFLVIRNKMRYGFTMVFDTRNDEGVKATLHEPVYVDAKDKVSISYSGLTRINMNEINVWKTKIKDSLFLSSKDIKFNFITKEDNGNVSLETLNSVDLLHKDNLKDTDSFKEFKYMYVNPFTTETEYLTFEISDVRDLETYCSPEHSGGALIHNGISAVNRGINGWGILKETERYDTTKNAIRFNVYADTFIFNQTCGNSAIKNECRALCHIVNPIDMSDIIFIDCNTNEECTIKEILKSVDKFIYQHKSDRRNVIDQNEVINDLNNLPDTERELVEWAVLILNEKCLSIKNKKFSSITDAIKSINNKKENMIVNA